MILARFDPASARYLIYGRDTESKVASINEHIKEMLRATPITIPKINNILNTQKYQKSPLDLILDKGANIQ
jgi:hypothetical protein